METVKIPLSSAREFTLTGQLLRDQVGRPTGKEGAARTVEELGYIQIDTIAVVQRAHHHTLWTRQPDYEPQMLHELQAVDRRVFEYWDTRPRTYQCQTIVTICRVCAVTTNQRIGGSGTDWKSTAT